MQQLRIQVFYAFFYIFWIFVPSGAQAFGESVCDPPPALSATDINYTYAEISWGVAPLANSYVVRLRQVGSSTWVETPIVNTEAIFYLLPCQQYEFQVQSVCDEGAGAFGASLFVTTLGCSDSYCFSYGENSNFEWIAAFTLNQISNASGVNYGYGNFTYLSTELQQGETYSLTLQPGFSGSAYGEYWRVWIDYNHDNNFSGANELVFDAGAVATQTLSASITIPATVPVGNTRLRVAMKWLNEGDLPPLPCEAFGFGETEDYNVVIVAPNCSGLSATVNTTAAACGQNNGSVSVAAMGGTAPYNIVWNTGQTAFTINGLPTGTYSFIVTDASGCTLSQELSIVNAGAPSLSVTSVVPDACGQGSGIATVATTGGTAPYTYSWSHNALLNSATASGLSAGSYLVSVTDANNCGAQLSLTVSSLAGPNLSVNSSSNPSCGQNNGFIGLQASGGTAPLSYHWSHDAGLVSNLAFNLAPGSYTCTVTDNNGCIDIETVNLSAVNNITLSVVSVFPEGCSLNNGSITVTTGGGGTAPLVYSWSHNPLLNSPTAGGLSAGTFTVTVTDALGCEAQISASVGVSNSAPDINVVTSVAANCGQPTGAVNVISVIGTGPFTYSWSHNPSLNSPIASGLIAGTYTVTVYATNGCFDTYTALVTNTGAPNVSLVSITNDLCGTAIGAATVSASAGTPPYTYLWSNGQTGTSAVNLTAGTYTVTVTDNSGCIAIQNATITNEVSLSSVTFTIQGTTCGLNNGSILAGSTGGVPPLTYSWSNGATTNPNTNLATGTYTLTVTDANGCTAVKSGLVTGTPVVAALINTVPATCGNANGSAQVLVTSGTAPYNYVWNNAAVTATITGLAAGTYSVTITDALGCTKSLQTVVNTTNPPLITLETLSAATCGSSNGFATVSASAGTPPYTYLPPFNNAGIATNLPAGTYTAIVTDANNCTATLPIEIPQTSNMDISTQSTATDCNGSDGSVTVTVNEGTPPYTYNWLADGTMWTSEEPEFTYSNLAGGNYTIQITDANGCFEEITVSVEQLNLPVINLESIVEIDAGGQAILDATTPNATYLWSTGETTPVIVVGTGAYSVAVTVEGCTAFAEVQVLVTSTNDVALLPDVSLYPNPVSNMLYINYNSPKAGSNLVLELADVSGKILERQQFNTALSSAQFTLSLQQYPSGIYLVSLSTPDYRTVKKVIKQ